MYHLIKKLNLSILKHLKLNFLFTLLLIRKLWKFNAHIYIEWFADLIFSTQPIPNLRHPQSPWYAKNSAKSKATPLQFN